MPQASEREEWSFTLQLQSKVAEPMKRKEKLLKYFSESVTAKN